MTHSVFCITNDVADLRSCVIPKRHLERCDGAARRYDRESGQTLIHDDEPCGGCLPRPAKVGRLCESHVLKLEHALERDTRGHRVLVDLVTHLWSIESGGVKDDNDRVSSAYGSRWPLSESHIMANEIYTELASTAVAIANDLKISEHEFDSRASILDGFSVGLEVEIVARIMVEMLNWIDVNVTPATRKAHTAERVVRLINATQTALARFPLVESEHRIPYVRCPSCARMSLTWKPPLMNLDDVQIKCERCGHVEDQEWLEQYIALIKTDERRLRR